MTKVANVHRRKNAAQRVGECRISALTSLRAVRKRRRNWQRPTPCTRTNPYNHM